MALPGLLSTSARAMDDGGVTLQYGRYQEGERDLYGVKGSFEPITVDSLYNSAAISLTDSTSLTVAFSQDTWSGATPISTAPSGNFGNGYGSLDGVSGASPYINSGGALYLDKLTLKPLKTDGYGTLLGGFDEQLVHTMSSASPEVRKQVDLTAHHEWTDVRVDAGGGISKEPDYRSVFGHAEGQWDLHQKLTTLSLALNYATSQTEAMLDHDASIYIYDACVFTCYQSSGSGHVEEIGAYGKRVLYGDRKDVGGRIGLTQVLDRSSFLAAGLGYTHSSGYLANPYKVVEVGFIDPDQQFFAPPDTLYVTYNALLEVRPDVRKQGTFDLSYVRHIESTNAAAHLSYRYFQDDWGIRSHTLEAQWVQPLARGWTVSPRLRYYSQDAADFYTPFLVTDQAQSPKVVDPVKGQVYVDMNNPDSGLLYYDDPNLENPLGYNPYTGNPVVDANGNPVSQEIADMLWPKSTTFDRTKLPAHYSSDHRLSAYGGLSGGLTLSRQFAPGVSLDLGYEYYLHAGSLKLGGGGEGSYADFHYSTITATLNVAFGAQDPSHGQGGVGSDTGDDDASSHAGMHSHPDAPAGVLFDHLLPHAGDFMIGYRYSAAQQSGQVLHGSRSISDAELKADGCASDGCKTLPTRMNMYMHMLEIMYAPSDRLTLMVMPQLVDNSMKMRGLLSEDETGSLGMAMAGLYYHHTMHEHQSGGVGDTGLYALIELRPRMDSSLHLGVGLSLPTGSVDQQLRRTHQMDPGFMSYDMQLGSGTWDFKPSLTYTRQADRWSWGAQANATLRLAEENKSGFAFGDIYQGTAWGGYRIGHWLSASLRTSYTTQGRITGAYNYTFNPFGPNDYPANHGGQFWDLGGGLSATAHSGVLKGNRLSLEWLQPLHDHVNGYQLERSGSLYATWSFAL